MKRLALVLMLSVAGMALAASDDVSALQSKAQAGDADAEFKLAEAYRSGRVGGDLDLESAIMWYRRAANQGLVRASEELGFTLFAHGDRREAMPYIEKAAARGEPRAFYLLGTAHFNGDYASRDWPLAYAQTTRAASAGLSAAIKNLALMDRYLLPTDRAKAEEILATLPPVRKARAVADTETASAPAAVKASSDAQSAPASPQKEPSAAKRASASKPAAPPNEDKATPTIIATSKAAKTKDKDKDRAVEAKSTARGPWKVQLGAFGSAPRIDQRWKDSIKKVPRIAKLEKRVAPGKVQRLLAAGIASKADAEALCKDVHAAGGDCLVLAP
jgi:uncharacterized protein